MNAVLTFLETNRQRLHLDDHGVPQPASWVIRTGQSRTSSHVVVLILDPRHGHPRLVAKVGRLPGVTGRLATEASNLEAVHALRPGGFDSIPRLVSVETFHGHCLLLLTALVGAPLEPALRGDLAGVCSTVTEWLIELHRHSRSSHEGWYERLVEQPSDHFAQIFPLSPDEASLVDRTRQLAESVRRDSLPLVFEQGDMSRPNILLLEKGGAGVVDWELAQPTGLPACDLFFFLANASFARAGSHRTGDYVTAFRAAYFGRGAWARPYVRRYAEAIGLDEAMLTPLFVLCWARYTDNLLRRLDEPSAARERPRPETVHWLRGYRLYTLWQYTIAHIDELDWED